MRVQTAEVHMVHANNQSWGSMHTPVLVELPELSAGAKRIKEKFPDFVRGVGEGDLGRSAHAPSRKETTLRGKQTNQTHESGNCSKFGIFLAGESCGTVSARARK